MWSWFSQGMRVLTVGSVHLDTIALSRSAGGGVGETEVGSIIHSVGGSAYNIAANLATHRPRSDAISDVGIYSILPQHSVLTEIIRYKGNAAGVNSRFLRLHKDFNNKKVRGGGYVGLLDEEQRLIRRAVVDAAMHDADIFHHQEEAATLENAIGWANILVLDSDLAVPTINHIAAHARTNRKPLFLSVGSALAGTRSWLHSNAANEADCLSGRSLVIRTMLANLNIAPGEIDKFRTFVDTGRESGAFDINEICRQLRTKYLVCSNVRESHGFALLASGDTPYKCFFKTPENIRSRMQAGNSAGVVDGALAGFIESFAHIVRRNSADKQAGIVNDRNRKTFQSNILDFVEHVSESEGATPGSVISFEEQVSQQSRLAKLWRLTKIAFDILPIFRVILSFVALIIALWLVDLALDVARYFGYNIEMLDKPWLRMLLRR